MRYFDGIVDGTFKTTNDGVVIFYPYSIFGAGYIIPSIEKKQEIRKQLKRFVFFSLMVIIISAYLLFLPLKILSLPWWIAGSIYLAIIAGLGLADCILSKRLINGLMQVDQKMTLAESYQNSAKSHNIVVLVMLEIVSVAFVIAGIWMILDPSMAWYFRLNGVLSILFFGLGGVVIGYMIKVKNKG